MNSPIRKNFVFDAIVAEHLEILAKEHQVSMTALLQDMIEKAYAEIEKRKKIEIAKSLIGHANGLFGNEKSIQTIKAERDV
jgi:hypothetical protein